ncbi:MAG: hypothetical protein AB7F09_21385 [Parvibaculaceae bacterium]
MSAAGGAGDFDFFIGRWNVVNERLTRRFVGADEWETFAATSDCRKLLGGAAHIDEIDIPAKALSGINLAVYDANDRSWSLHWMDSHARVFFPALRGRFTGGRGVFHGDDADDGRPVKVRFLWLACDREPRWEQAFSIDDGRTWETNWIMKFSRAA